MKYNYIILAIFGLLFITSNAKLAVREMNDEKEMTEEELKDFVKGNIFIIIIIIQKYK